jgi:hypothetical protein
VYLVIRRARPNADLADAVKRRDAVLPEQTFAVAAPRAPFEKID